VGERISLLVTVKAYPAISTKYGEVVCVAGIRTDTKRPEWVRLFPVPFRDLPFDQRFKKYDVIELEAQRHPSDARPESYLPNVDSLEVLQHLDTKKGWSRRRPFVEPLVLDSMCEIQRRQKGDGTSLGIFAPAEVGDFTIERNTAEWDPAKARVVVQPSLLFPGKKGLEKIPYRFRYQYRCGDSKCPGHHQSIIDWELAEAFRSWPYPEPERLQKIRTRWLDQMCAASRETYFFVGNIHQHPEAFLVLGVFWPPRA
jgi:hypothetical protein